MRIIPYFVCSNRKSLIPTGYLTFDAFNSKYTDWSESRDDDGKILWVADEILELDQSYNPLKIYPTTLYPLSTDEDNALFYLPVDDPSESMIVMQDSHPYLARKDNAFSIDFRYQYLQHEESTPASYDFLCLKRKSDGLKHLNVKLYTGINGKYHRFWIEVVNGDGSLIHSTSIDYESPDSNSYTPANARFYYDGMTASFSIGSETTSLDISSYIPFDDDGESLFSIFDNRVGDQNIFESYHWYKLLITHYE